MTGPLLVRKDSFMIRKAIGQEESLVGRRYGKLLVLAESPRTARRHDHRRSWICACDCGTFCIGQTDRLVCGAIKSCGCIHAERMRNSRQKLERAEKEKIEKESRQSRQPDALDFLFGRRT